MRTGWPPTNRPSRAPRGEWAEVEGGRRRGFGWWIVAIPNHVGHIAHPRPEVVVGVADIPVPVQWVGDVIAGRGHGLLPRAPMLRRFPTAVVCGERAVISRCETGLGLCGARPHYFRDATQSSAVVASPTTSGLTRFIGDSLSERAAPVGVACRKYSPWGGGYRSQETVQERPPVRGRLRRTALGRIGEDSRDVTSTMLRSPRPRSRPPGLAGRMVAADRLDLEESQNRQLNRISPEVADQGPAGGSDGRGSAA